MRTLTKLSAWTLVILLALPGCVPSLNPVYREQDLVFDAALLGVWNQARSDNGWEFSRLDDKTYRLVYSDKSGQQGHFLARLADVRGTRFLDLFPEDIDQDSSGFYKFHLVPIHTIYLVRGTGKRLELAAMDYKWLNQFLTDHPEAVQHAAFDGRKMLTAPTHEVQEFLLKHKDAFTENFELERTGAVN